MSKRNLIVLTSHDLGAHLNCYGHTTVESPNIDRLAAQGTLFENYFCTAPTCSPSRAGLWTGRYPHSTGMLGLVHQPFYWSLHDDEKHTAQFFKEDDYQTGLFGDQHCNFPDAKRLGYDFEEPGKKYINPPAEYSAGKMTEWLNSDVSNEKPFMLQIGFHEPHRPFDHCGTEPYDKKGVEVPDFLPDNEYFRKDFAGYQGAIKRLDDAVGMVLDALDESGHADNTTVVFTVDHGIPFPRAKMNLYDPGLRTALIIRDPACQGGRRVEHMLSNVDLNPTLLEHFGYTPVPNVHGRSFLPLLAGGDYVEREEIFATQTYHGSNYIPMRAMRTHTHKYIINFYHQQVLTKPPKHDAAEQVAASEVLSRARPTFELYDLEADPKEFENVSGKPEYREVEQAMDRRIRDWMKETQDPILSGPPPSCHWHEAMAERMFD
ncbi:MAG: sulfatase [Planctomycetota bacterium]